MPRPLYRFPGRTALLAALALAACHDPAGPGDVPRIEELPRPLTTAEKTVISRSNAFGVELMREVLAVDDRPNVVLSPLSASMALGMALNGASETTFDGMRAALDFDGMSQEDINASYRGLLELLTGLDPSVDVSLANSAWANEEYTFHQSFFDAVTAGFDAEVRTLDYADPATLEAINGWVHEKTQGRIEKIVEDLDPRMALLLLNAVWFDGKWTTAFDPDDTAPRSFRRDDGTEVTVQMMRLRDVEVGFGGNDRVVAVELPYGGGAFTMVVAVPSGHGSGGAREVFAAMSPEEWNALVGSLQVREIDAVEIPRFTLSYDAILNAPLTAMGMGEAFTSRADFDRLSPTPLCIDWVRQKTFIEVDEVGTKAAAVTGVGMGPTSFVGLVADRPFLFAIRERLSGTILFTGLIGDPTHAESEPPDPPGVCANR